MVTTNGPSPAELEQQLGITAQEAQIVADAMTPVQKLAGAGSGIGSALDNAPGAGPRLVGAMLENIAMHVELTASNVETLARALDFYIQAHGEGVRETFPPPHALMQQVSEDVEPLVEALFREDL